MTTRDHHSAGTGETTGEIRLGASRDRERDSHKRRGVATRHSRGSGSRANLRLNASANRCARARSRSAQIVHDGSLPLLGRLRGSKSMSRWIHALAMVLLIGCGENGKGTTHQILGTQLASREKLDLRAFLYAL